MNIAAFEGLTPLEIFRKFAPEFAAVPDEVVQGYIDFATFYVCVDEYGKAYNVALALMAAHIMASPGGYSQDGSSSSGKVCHAKKVICLSPMAMFPAIPATSVAPHMETCSSCSVNAWGLVFLL